MKLRRFVPLLAGLAAVSLAAGCGSTSSPRPRPPQVPPPCPCRERRRRHRRSPRPSRRPPPPGRCRARGRGPTAAPSPARPNLTWTQTGSSLSGSIDLTPGGTESLTGTVSGNTIQFGAVGSEALTYNGTVSGDSPCPAATRSPAWAAAPGPPARPPEPGVGARPVRLSRRPSAPGPGGVVLLVTVVSIDRRRTGRRGCKPRRPVADPRRPGVSSGAGGRGPAGPGAARVDRLDAASYADDR